MDIYLYLSISNNVNNSIMLCGYLKLSHMFLKLIVKTLQVVR